MENFCRHHEGALAPQLIVLELWQKALLSVLFGVVDDTDHRQFREVVVIIARKNGKTLLAAAIAAYCSFWTVSMAGASTLPRLSWSKRGCATMPIIRCSPRTQS
ncbi:terminase large subunit [Gemmiger formicilis]|nr:terminase large subunit [Gemmiger formicilis]